MIAPGVVKHLRIAVQFARIGVIRKAQFRVEFFFQVLMDLLWYAAHVAVFEILFLHADSIAGWDRDEIRVFLGFLFVSDAFMMMWLGQAWRFGRDLKDGRLDPVRVRPAAPVFLYFFQSFSLEAVLNMAVAVGYLGFGLACADVPATLASSGLLVWAVVLALWARIVTLVGYSLVEFWLLNSDAAHFLHHFVEAAADRPVDIFGRRIRLFLLHVVPVAAMTQLPSALVLGKWSVLAGVGHTAGLALLGWIVFRLWGVGMRRYESAMS